MKITPGDLFALLRENHVPHPAAVKIVMIAVDDDSQQRMVREQWRARKLHVEIKQALMDQEYAIKS